MKFLLSFIIIFLFFSLNAQDGISIERKCKRFQTALYDFEKLKTKANYSQNILIRTKDEIFRVANNCPLIIGESIELSPNVEKLEKWIIEFPQEFEDLIIYLEKTNRSIN